jgi:hypothetical protein
MTSCEVREQELKRMKDCLHITLIRWVGLCKAGSLRVSNPSAISQASSSSAVHEGD